jgi:hypothetical protein
MPQCVRPGSSSDIFPPDTGGPYPTVRLVCETYRLFLPASIRPPHAPTPDERRLFDTWTADMSILLGPFNKDRFELDLWRCFRVDEGHIRVTAIAGPSVEPTVAHQFEDPVSPFSLIGNSSSSLDHHDLNRSATCGENMHAYASNLEARVCGARLYMSFFGIALTEG